MSTSPLTMREEGEWTVVDARSAGLPVVAFTVLSAILGTIVAFVLSLVAIARDWHIFGWHFFFTMIVVCGVAIDAFLLWKLKRDRLMQPGPFAMNKTGIRTPQGEIIPAQDLDYVRARCTAAGSSMGKGLSEVSWVVEVDHQGSSVPLAGGLTRPLADAVLLRIKQTVPGFR